MLEEWKAFVAVTFTPPIWAVPPFCIGWPFSTPCPCKYEKISELETTFGPAPRAVVGGPAPRSRLAVLAALPLQIREDLEIGHHVRARLLRYGDGVPHVVEVAVGQQDGFDVAGLPQVLRRRGVLAPVWAYEDL